MTVDQFILFLTYGIYGVIFCVVAVKAVRHPLRVNIDILLLFACPTIIIAFTIANDLNLITTSLFLKAILNSLLIVMCYMLLRLVDDFSYVPVWLMRVTSGLLIVCISAVLLSASQPSLPVGFEILFGVSLIIYTVGAFVRESHRSSGVTMRRMRAVALGSLSICALLVLAGAVIVVPQLNTFFGIPAVFAILGSAIGYFLGFAPPGIVRRLWQEPELRAFLGQAASLPNIPDMESILKELEQGAASSVGATEASIGLWDDSLQALRFNVGGSQLDVDPNQSLMGTVFLSQQAIYSDTTGRNQKGLRPSSSAPSQAQGFGLLRSGGVPFGFLNLRKTDGDPSESATGRSGAALLAPITAGKKRLGVLSVYAARASIFVEEDLSVVQLLANQAAVVLESRALIDTSARVQAREEVARLKGDFLSAAAHDLKTPLSTIMLQVELMERNTMRRPDAPTDLSALQKMKTEIYRLKSLTLELLDIARAEQGKLLARREAVDMVKCAQEVCSRKGTERHPCIVQAVGPVVGLYDPNRITQLIENLVENAVKYSPDGGPVSLKIWHEQIPSGDSAGRDYGDSDGAERGLNHLTITDCGIGIPKEDVPYLFEQFHRGSNVDDRNFAGMGLGLFICRGIVEQHGGKIWVESPTANESGSRHDKGRDASAAISTKQGSTFHVVLGVESPAI